MTDFFNQDFKLLKIQRRLRNQIERIFVDGKDVIIVLKDKRRLKYKLSNLAKTVEVVVSQNGTNYYKAGTVEYLISKLPEDRLFPNKDVSEKNCKSENQLTKEESAKIMEILPKLQKMEKMFKKK
jgi:hypothetical protein